MSQQPVRVRIAPSPSGYVHVGTARMAICNFLFARHEGGQFLVRIEDTDQARSKKEYVDGILAAFKWLGLDWDEEIVYQSQRSDLYREHVQKILDSGHGYRCFCTIEQLQKDRELARAEKRNPHYNRRCLKLSPDEIAQKLADKTPCTIRVKIPDGTTTNNDLVSGELSRQNVEIEDLIIARSDGTATYNLAVVVDDHTMGISHVIRGNDHVTNTFKQIQIYRGLGWEPPQFGHMPLILRKDKKKVSKRLGDKDVMAYREDGIMPEAMFNFLCLLGWSSKTDREVFTVAELIDIFNTEHLNASNAVFDEDKLLAINREHIGMMSEHDLAVLVAPLLVEAGLTSKYWLETRWEYLRSVLGLLKSRASRLSDFVERAGYFFQFEGQYDATAVAKHFHAEAADTLEELAGRFESLSLFNHDAIAETLSEMADEKELKKGQLIHPVRLAVSGMPVGPSLYEMLELLSQTTVVERMRLAAKFIRANV
jgi:glutamyl-tRNA synthetase